ncbi:hypothetical protein [Candidatus Finniella inopinata]|nr:hypothetical protein [Candidatus Finniella inopinata]
MVPYIVMQVAGALVGASIRLYDRLWQGWRGQRLPLPSLFC